MTILDRNQLARRALQVFPGGSNGEFNLPPDHAIVIQRGKGCRLWDVDGNEYLDFSMGWGSALVGHAHPHVTAAVRHQAPHGANFAYITKNSLALAEEIIRLSPAADQVRFCASGTEATMYCQRLARAYTGRDKILKFEGAYHGANEVGVTSLFPSGRTEFPQPEPSSHGIDPLVRDHVLVAPFNDLDTTRSIIDAHARDLAAVIVEPLHRCLPPKTGFLEKLREICSRNNILLIFDEVVTGFRLAYGGAQEYYGVTPDLVAYGKALGGGYPIGVFGGRADIMKLVREDRMGHDTYVWVASTLGGNPISTSAAMASLEVFGTAGTYERLHRLGKYFRDGLREVLQAREEDAQVIGDGPLGQIVFTNEKVHDYRSLKRGDSARARLLMLGLFARGVFLNPMGTKLYLSLAHNEEVVDAFLDRLNEVLGELPRPSR